MTVTGRGQDPNYNHQFRLIRRVGQSNLHMLGKTTLPFEGLCMIVPF